MTKEEKKNVIIALALCVAAVIIIWLLGRAGGNINYGSYTGDQFNPADLPASGGNYANYNILPGAFPNIPGVNVGGNTTNTDTGGGCCATMCGNPNSPGQGGYWLFRQVLGG